MFNKIKDWYQALPDKKKHVEFFTALLTVPVLLTVLMINLANINNNKKEPTPTPAPTEKIVIVTNPVSSTTTASPTITPGVTLPECKKEVGPVKISSPAEGQLVNKNPVCLKINYQVGEYCSVVWSYLIDNSDWSDFTDKEVCLYDMTPGPKELELRIKSSVSDDEVTLIRNFYYKNKDIPTVTPTLTPIP